MPTLTASPVVLITGALSDIGRAAAAAFHQAGYAVVLASHHSGEPAQAFAQHLQAAPPGTPVTLLPVDVRYRAQVQALFDQAYAALGRVDVLINNAGINRDQAFTAMSDEEWDRVVDTILKGSFLCSQEFARRYTGTQGVILNIGAVTALKGRANGANYCSARAGVLALTKCMAQELAPHIRVNTVTPGRIDTEELRTRYHLEDEDKRAHLEQEVPLKRLGSPEDIAGLMVYLVTAGPYITGQNFFVDGGLYMR